MIIFFYHRVLNAAALILKDAKVDYKYIIPREICVMLNVFASARAQVNYQLQNFWVIKVKISTKEMSKWSNYIFFPFIVGTSMYRWKNYSRWGKYDNTIFCLLL